MKRKENIKGLKTSVILLLLIAYSVLYVKVLLKDYLVYSESITAAVMLIATFFSIIGLGYRKDKLTHLKKNVIQIVITQVIIYFIILYGLGFVVGFLRNSYSLALPSIIENVMSPIITIVCAEVMRYTIISANKNRKYLIVLTTLVLILLEVMMKVRIEEFNTLLNSFKISTTIVLPSIVKNCVLSYTAYYVGYKPAIIYRLVLDTYFYLVPIAPNLGDYITSMLGVALPFLVYLYSSRLINEYYKGVEYVFKTDAIKLADLPFIGLVVVLICLISGYFPYFLVGVATASMTPKIDIGDAVLSHQVKNDDELKVDDIIVYHKGEKLIVHRIIDKYEKKGKTIYKTKGDANNTADNVELTLDDIKGKVIFKIKYIAKPSVYISELFEKE